MSLGSLISGHACLYIVGGSRDIAAATSPVDVDVLALWILLARELRLDDERVGAKVVTLSLDHVRGAVLRAVPVEPCKSGGKGRSGNTPLNTLADDVSPAGLCLVDGLVEEVVEEQVLQIGVGTVGAGDVLQEDRADNAPPTPHEGNRWLVELPAVFFGRLYYRSGHGSRRSGTHTYMLHQHETLCVGNDLRGIQRLLQVGKELFLVAGEGGRRAGEHLGCPATLVFQRTQAP